MSCSPAHRQATRDGQRQRIRRGGLTRDIRACPLCSPRGRCRVNVGDGKPSCAGARGTRAAPPVADPRYPKRRGTADVCAIMARAVMSETRNERNPAVGYFCHIMKTGGSSVRQMLLQDVLEAHELAPHLPNADDVSRLISLVLNPWLVRGRSPWLVRGHLPKDSQPIKVIAGHYPFLAYRLHPPPVKTFCLFRDPVDRVVSHLRHLRRESHPDRSYEDLYADQDLYDRFFYNLQARAFVFDSKTARTLLERTFDWNDERLERAKENLKLLDVLGLTSEFPMFVRDLERAFGWKFRRVVRMHEAPEKQDRVPDALRNRIREDLEYDIRFYDHVVRVWEERHATAT
jgi:hypothetical protein